MEAVYYKQLDDNFSDLIRLMRPYQWIKNVFVFAGLACADHLFDVSNLQNLFTAFLIFCGISGSVYIFNDIIDLEKDKLHPDKKIRPLASGVIKIRTAVGFLLVLCSISLIHAFLFSKEFFIVAFLYLMLNLFYSTYFKNIIIVDIAFISAGFMLRVIGGAFAISQTPSLWILLCTFFICFYLGLNKRKQELITLSNVAGRHRKNLEKYSERKISRVLPITMWGTIITYAVYIISGTKSRLSILTIPFVAYGLMRYQYLASHKGIGDKPELVRKDVPFMLNAFFWLIFFAFTAS